MASKFKMLACRPADTEAADRVFGSIIPLAERLGLGVRAFASLSPEQQMDLIRTHRSHGTQPIGTNDARSTGMTALAG